MLSLVTRIKLVKLLVTITAHKNWNIHQIDAKSTFLNGHLEEELYMHQPQGFKKASEEQKVCKLKKALYGLKQAPKGSTKIIEFFFL